MGKELQISVNSVYLAYLANLLLFSIPPLYLATLPPMVRRVGLYSYLSIILLIGGVLGGVYTFPLADGLTLSGGNMAYGAFMMTAVMLLITERREYVFHYLLRLLISVNLFVFCGFEFLLWVLESPSMVNFNNLNPDLFRVSLWVMLLGGTMIALQFLLMMQLFIWLKKWLKTLAAVTGVYTLVFILVLCLDGVVFPLILVGLEPELIEKMISNLRGKLVLAISFSLPLLLFYWLFRNNLRAFIRTPLTIRKLLYVSRDQLIRELNASHSEASRLKEDNAQLAKQSQQDHLTGLSNRRHFDDRFQYYWLHSMQEGEPFSLVIGDIDFFKRYNDRYGHQQGDRCLQQVGALWRRYLLSHGALVAARIGGEELAALFPGKNEAQVKHLLQGFIEALLALGIEHKDSEAAAVVSMSLGVACHLPNQNHAPSELFAQADEALYRAKTLGRNRVEAASG